MKTHLNIEAGKRVRGECKLSAPKRKDGTLVLRMTLTSIIEDDALEDTVFAGPLRNEHDHLVKVRKTVDAEVVGRDVKATMRATLCAVTVEPVFDGAPGDRVVDGIDGVIRTLRVTGGERHTKQVAVIDLLGTSKQLGGMLDVHGCEVLVRVRSKQPGLFTVEEEADDDLPDEPVGGVQVTMDAVNVSGQPLVEGQLVTPDQVKPRARRKTTEASDA